MFMCHLENLARKGLMFNDALIQGRDTKEQELLLQAWFASD